MDTMLDTALTMRAYRVREKTRLPKEFWVLAEAGDMLLIETEHGTSTIDRNDLEQGLRAGTIESLEPLTE